MKKFAVFLLFFTFLAGVVWGQQDIYTWADVPSGDWNTAANWVIGGVPATNYPGEIYNTDEVIINNGTVNLTTPITIASLTNNLNANIDLGTSTLTATTPIINNGTLILNGVAGQLPGQINIGGTVRYTGNGTTLSGITSFANLTIENGTRTGAGVISVSGNFVISGGSLSATSINVDGTSSIGGDITTDNNQDYTGQVTLNNDSLNDSLKLKGSSIIFRNVINGNNNSLTITVSVNTIFYLGGSGLSDLEIIGNAIFGNALPPTGSLSADTVIVTGDSRLLMNISTTGNQDHGSVTLYSTAPTAATRILTGDIITMGAITTHNSITNGDLALTINGNAKFNGVNNNRIRTLSVSGASQINGNITTSGVQTYTGAVTLKGDSILEGTTVTLGSITGDGHSLTVTASASAQFNGGSDINVLIIYGAATLAAPMTNIGSVTVSGGTATINSNITTINNQSYAAVNLGAVPRTLTSTNGSVTASGIVSGTAGVTVNASTGIQMDAANTLNTNITGSLVILNNNQNTVSGNISFNTTGGITLNAKNNTINGSITINRSGTLQIDSLETSGTGGSITLGSVVGTVGAVTQTGVISTNNLTINSSGAINLASDNIVNTLTINGAGGAVQFRNTNTLLTVAGVGGLTGTYQRDISITNSGDITLSGSINNAGVVTLTSGSNQNITVNNNINSARLLLISGINDLSTATTGTVTLSGNINVSSSSTSETTPAVRIKAGTFAGTSTITATNNGSICVYLYSTLTYTGTVTSTGGIHYHTVSNRNILYTITNPTTDITDIISVGNFLRINADDNLGAALNFTTGGNLYIIDINANTNRNLAFTVGGFTEFRGNNTLTGTFTLNPETSIRLRNASVNRGTNTFNFNVPVTLYGTVVNSITASGISLGAITGAGTGSGNSLTLTGNATLRGGNGINNLQISGNAAFQTAAINAAAVNVTGTSAINADIITTGDQTYNGQVTFGSGNRTITSTAGNQTYNSPITLGSNVNFTGGSSSLIDFVQTINGANSLTVTTANVKFGGAVGRINSLTSITVTGTPAGTATFALPATPDNIIRTNASQSYNGAVALDSDVHLDAGAGNNVILGSVTGRITGNGKTLTITGNATLNGTAVSYLGALQLNQNGIFQTANIQAASVNVAGTSQINVNIDTGGNQTYSGSVTLGGATGSANPRILTGATVLIGHITGTDRSLTVTASALALFNGGNDIDALRITGNAEFHTSVINAVSVVVTGNTEFFSSADVSTLSASPASFQTYTGTVTLNSGINFTGSAGTLINFLNTVNGAASLTVNNANVRFDGNVGNSTPLTSINITGGGEARIFTSNITTSGTQTYHGPVMLGNNVNFTANPSSVIWFINTINGAYSLQITAADVVFDDNVGANVNRLNSVTTDIGSAAINASIFTLNDQIYNGPVEIRNIVTRLDSNTGDIKLNYNATVPAVSGSGNLFMKTDGNIIIQGQIGTVSAPVGNVTVESANNITIGQDGQSNITFNAREIRVENKGLYTQYGDVTTALIRQTSQSGTGTVDLGGNITVTTSISFVSPVTLINNDVTFTVPATGGYLEFNRLNQGSGPYSLTLNGGRSAASFLLGHITQPVIINSDIIISSNSYVRVNNGTIVEQTNGKKLTLLSGDTSTAENTTLDVSPGSWYMGGTAGNTGDFRGIDGTLILGGTFTRDSRSLLSSRLIANNLNLIGSNFKIENDGWAYITASGTTVNIGTTANNVNFNNLPYLILEMIRNGTQNLITEQYLGSLHVGANSRTVLSTNKIDPATSVNTVYFRGEVIINASLSPAGLDAEENDVNIVMYAGLTGNRDTQNYLHSGSNDVYYSRWEIPHVTIGSDAYPRPPFIPKPDMKHFVFRQKEGRQVSFRRDETTGYNSAAPVFFEIAGNTMWQSFECRVPGSVVQFSRHPNHHTILYKFLIGIDPSNPPSNLHDPNQYVTITRLTEDVIYSSFPYIYNPNIMGAPPFVPPYPTPNASVGTLGQWALPVFYPPMNLKNAGDNELGKYWNINFISTPGFLPLDNFNYVRVFFSHAYNSRIPIESDMMHLDVIPYYDPSTLAGFFNYDWIELRKILYSFTEDSNGNGRLDRIRVQTNVPLNGNFSGFDVSIEGYEINRSIGENGFRMVYEVTGAQAFDADSFYIYLIESPYLDTGSTPLWSVTRNTTLKDALTGVSLVGDPQVDIGIKPIDTIPPRVAYTLTLPGQPQTYVRMSEPVVSGTFTGGTNYRSRQPIEDTSSYSYIWKYFQIDGIEKDFYSSVPSANLGYLLQWQDPYSVSFLTGIKNIYGDTSVLNSGYFQIQNMIDQSQRAMDWRDHHLDQSYYIYYAAPKYPINWGYTAYARVFGNKHMLELLYPEFNEDEPFAEIAGPSPNPFPISDVLLPPYHLLNVDMMTKIASGNGNQITPSSFGSPHSVIRRITDVLVSIPPDNANSQNYFAWPVWARYQVPPNTPGYNSNNQFWGQSPTDTGIIWIFDGTAYLEAEDIDIQARINSSLSNLGLGLELFWITNVPAQLRIPYAAPARGRYTGGLWLPDLNSINGKQPLYNFAPVFSMNSVGKAALSASANPLYVFQIARNDPPGFSSGQKIEFLLRFTSSANPNSDMFIARLDTQNANTIPWYQRVRPFGFDIQDIRLQRGGVTILNNVIVPITEYAYIRYNLIRPGRVTIQVHTLDGTLVRSIRRNEYREAGEWTDAWNGTNNSGTAVARGMYYIRVVGPDIDEIRQIMVVR